MKNAYFVEHWKGGYWLWTCPECGQDNLIEEPICDNCQAIEAEWEELGLNDDEE